MTHHLASFRGLRSTALAATLLAGTALSAAAAPVTFNFTSSGGTATGSGYSNQRVYSSGGVTLTVTAWSVGSSSLNRANVGYYSGAGLGVCSTADGSSSCSSPSHQADNAGAQEFILFQFSMPVDPTSVVINPHGTYDRDVRYYVGNASVSLATVDASLPSALGTQFDYAGSVGSSAVTVALNGSTSALTLLVGVPTIGSSSSSTPDKFADYWKLESLVVDYTAAPPPPPPPPGGAGDPVPAPGALALFGAAIAGLTIARRRRG